jgi:hypothetical protein
MELDTRKDPPQQQEQPLLRDPQSVELQAIAGVKYATLGV